MSKSLQEPELTASNFFLTEWISSPPEQFELEWHRGTCLKGEIGLGHHIERVEIGMLYMNKKKCMEKDLEVEDRKL